VAVSRLLVGENLEPMNIQDPSPELLERGRGEA